MKAAVFAPMLSIGISPDKKVVLLTMHGRDVARVLVGEDGLLKVEPLVETYTDDELAKKLVDEINDALASAPPREGERPA